MQEKWFVAFPSSSFGICRRIKSRNGARNRANQLILQEFFILRFLQNLQNGKNLRGIGHKKINKKWIKTE